MSKLTKIQEFIIFSMEAYRKQYKLNGQEVFDLFQKFEIFSYLENGYDVLHSQSMDYIVSEIDELIINRK